MSPRARMIPTRDPLRVAARRLIGGVVRFVIAVAVVASLFTILSAIADVIEPSN